MSEHEFSDHDFARTVALLKVAKLPDAELMFTRCMDALRKTRPDLTVEDLHAMSDADPQSMAALVGHRVFGLALQTKMLLGLEASAVHAMEASERDEERLDQLADMRARLELARDTLNAVHPELMTAGMRALLTPPPITRSKP